MRDKITKVSGVSSFYFFLLSHFWIYDLNVKTKLMSNDLLAQHMAKTDYASRKSLKNESKY